MIENLFGERESQTSHSVNSFCPVSDQHRVDAEFLNAEGKFEGRRIGGLALRRVEIIFTGRTFEKPLMHSKGIEQINEIIGQGDLLEQRQMLVA